MPLRPPTRTPISTLCRVRSKCYHRQMFAEITGAFVLKNLPESQVELVGEVPYSAVEPYREKALKHIAEHMALPGFRPDIRVTKLAAGNPVGLTVRATVYPEVALPKNWKQLHEKVALEPALPASEEEVTKTLEDLRQSRKTGDTAPELSDEFAKSVGAFESLEHLKTQIHKGIGEEKTRKARDARRGKLIEALLEKSTLSVPRIFIESELEKIMSQMREDVKRFGMEFEEYLKKTNKTEEGVRNEFREQARKRAQLQLLLNKIAQEEKLEADETAVATEIKHAMEHFPDANPELVKIHIETVIKNELALKLLEGEVK